MGVEVGVTVGVGVGVGVGVEVGVTVGVGVGVGVGVEVSVASEQAINDIRATISKSTALTMIAVLVVMPLPFQVSSESPNLTLPSQGGFPSSALAMLSPLAGGCQGLHRGLDQPV